MSKKRTTLAAGVLTLVNALGYDGRRGESSVPRYGSDLLPGRCGCVAAIVERRPEYKFSC